MDYSDYLALIGQRLQSVKYEVFKSKEEVRQRILGKDSHIEHTVSIHFERLGLGLLAVRDPTIGYRFFCVLKSVQNSGIDQVKGQIYTDTLQVHDLVQEFENSVKE